MRRAVTASVLAGSVAVALTAFNTPTASAGGVARVRIVDHYNHGRVKVTLNEISRKLAYGDRTRRLSVTPAANGNDTISVKSLRHPTCGYGDAGRYFLAGHRYRAVVKPAGKCFPNGKTFRAPTLVIVQVD